MNKENTNVLKAIAILFVLFGHTNFLDSSGAWGVHIFLLLSGYGLERSYQKNGLVDFWKKRFCRVFIPYEAIILIALPIEMLLNKKCGIINVIASVAGFDVGYNIDPSMWYISYCFLLYTEFYIWKKLEERTENIGRGYILLLVFMTLNFFLSIMDKLKVVSLWSPAAQVWVYTVDFFAGIAFANHLRYSKIGKCFFGVTALIYFIARYGKIHHKADLLMFSMSAAVVTVLLSGELKLYRCKVIQKLGKSSLWIYLLEGHFLRWKGYLLGSNSGILVNLIVISMCIFVGHMCYQLNNVIRNKVGGGKLLY